MYIQSSMPEKSHYFLSGGRPLKGRVKCMPSPRTVSTSKDIKMHLFLEYITVENR